MDRYEKWFGKPAEEYAKENYKRKIARLDQVKAEILEVVEGTDYSALPELVVERNVLVAETEAMAEVLGIGVEQE